MDSVEFLAYQLLNSGMMIMDPAGLSLDIH